MGTYTNKPKGKYPLAEGDHDYELDFSRHKEIIKTITEKTISDFDRHILGWCGWFYRKAFENPSVVQRRYSEENGYEHEERIVYDAQTGIMTTNTCVCPFASGHHIGDTCFVCKQKD